MNEWVLEWEDTDPSWKSELKLFNTGSFKEDAACVYPPVAPVVNQTLKYCSAADLSCRFSCSHAHLNNEMAILYLINPCVGFVSCFQH